MGTIALTIRVNAKTSESSTTPFECYIRTVLPNNGTLNQLKLSFSTTY